MKAITKFYICGITCKPGKENCNNYCNHNKNEIMPDSPATYEQLVMEEIDMWEDVIEIIAGYVPQEKTVFEMLQSKYKIKTND